MFKVNKISTSFLLPILLAVFSILMLLTVYDVTTERQRLTEEMVAQTESFVGIASAAAAHSFWNYNNSELASIGDALYTYKEVASVKMVDDTDSVVYLQNKGGIAYDPSYLYPALSQTLNYEDVEVGTIEITLTSYYLRLQITQAIMFGFIKTLLIIGILWLLILMLTRNITTSLDKIAVGVKRFGEGFEKERVQVKSGHEMNALANDLNALFDVIVDSRQKLHDNFEVLKANEEVLRMAEERYRYAVEGSNDAMWDWEVLTNRYFVSKRGAQMVGLVDNDKICLNTWIGLIHPQDVLNYKRYLDQFTHSPETFGQIQYRVISNKGEVRWLFCRGRGILDGEGKLVRVSGFITDITERIQAEESINRLAYYDVLTGLPNRVMLFDKISKQLFSEDSSEGALLFLDIDNFKTINDIQGHSVGDQVLIAIGDSLTKNIDSDAVARVGGDEFVVIKKDCTAMEAGELAREIIDTVKQPCKVDDLAFHLTCSVGVAMYPGDGNHIDTLFMNADNAMYQTKEQGKDGYTFYEKSMNDLMVEKIKLQDEIRSGLMSQEFIVYYQPQIDMKSSKLVGVEALVRWQHPKRGLLPPIAFIGVAEETGLIIPLGEYVLEEACKQSVLWEKMGLSNIAMAVNMSAKQFVKKSVVEDVVRVVSRTGMRADLLNIEITESIAMENLKSTVLVMEELKKESIRFSLDDFGTGYSSLNYLKSLPIDHLKIDKHFVQSVEKDNFEDVVVKAIIDIAHSMDLIVVAEGVETEVQRDTLKACDCDIVQGYLYSRPVPPERVEEMLYKMMKA